MNDNKGYIKIYRKIMEWEWYTDTNVKVVFIHCLLKANFTQKNWRGITIERGSFITSYATLARELNLSVKQVRLAIEKLKRTGELAIKTTNKYSIITIKNYDEYQSQDMQEGKQEDTQRANKGQTKGKQRATTNNDNNDKNDKNDKNRRSKYIPTAHQNDAQEIVTLVTENINPILNSIEIQLIQEWINEHPKELIIEAIKETALNKATSIKYTDAILRSWKSKNIRSLQDLEQHSTRRQTSKSRNYEVSTPEWLKEHEERRRNTSETIEQVSIEDAQKILKQFQ